MARGGVSVEIKGLTEILTRLNYLGAASGEGVEEGLVKSGEILLDYAKEAVPVVTGKLKASGFTRKGDGSTGYDTRVLVGFTEPYAWLVHETHANKSREDGKESKFLEKPARGHRDEFAHLIGENVKAKWKRGAATR